MSNLEDLAKAARTAREPKPVVDYRSPSPRPWRRWSLPAPVSLARIIGWSLTGFAVLQAVVAALWLLGALLSMFSSSSLLRAAAGLDLLMALGFMAGALTVGALGQIVLLLAELVVQGRGRHT